MAHIFGSIWDRFNRNALNDLSKNVEIQGKTIQDLVAEGQLTPKQYAELVTTINSLIKSGNVDKSDLTPEFKGEIEGFSTQLAEKANEDEVRKDTNIHPINVSEMDTETKQLFTGGAVAVVGENAVGRENVKPKTISPEKTTYFERSKKNLFDGVYLSNFTLFKGTGTGDFGAIGYSANADRYVAVIEIEPGETYTVTKLQGGDRLNVVLTNIYPNRDGYSFALKTVYQGAQDGSQQSYTFTNDVNAKYLIVQTNLEVVGTPDLQVERGIKYTGYESGLFIPRDRLESLKEGEITPSLTSFFIPSDKNMFGGEYLSNFTYFNAGPGVGEYGAIGYSASADRYIAVIEIEDEETYTVTKLEGGNRFNVLLIDDYPNTSGYSQALKQTYQGEFNDNQQTHTITNDVNAKYLVVQTNLGVDGTPRLQVEKGDEYTGYQSKVVIPKEHLELEPQKAVKKDYSFNYYANLNQLYRKESEIEYITNPGTLTVEGFHDMFNNLIDNNEGATSELLGGSTGDYPLYKYESKPNAYRVGASENGSSGGTPMNIPKIVIVTGIHGQERSPNYSAYYLFKEILENPSNNELIEFLKMNVHIICVPVVNGSGWTDKTYNNRNGVQLNRDFPPYGNASQAETILVKEVLDEHSDMDFFIDFHNMNFRDGYIGYGFSYDDIFINSMNLMYKSLGRSWQKEYSGFPQDIHHEWAYNTTPNIGTVALYTKSEYDIPSVLLEVIRRNDWIGDGEYGESVVRMGVEILVNAIIGALRTK